MANLAEINGRVRVRYRIHLAQIKIDRSRQYRTKLEAKNRLALAHDLEYKTKYQEYTSHDLGLWKRARLINEDDTRLLAASIGIGTFDDSLGPKRIRELRLDAINEFIEDWMQFNPEKRDIPKLLRLAIITRDKGICRVCGRKSLDVPIEVDHIVPFSRGGKTTPHNLQTCCHDCNIAKHSKYKFHINKEV